MVEHGVFDSYGCARKSDEMFARITMEIHDTYKQHRQSYTLSFCGLEANDKIVFQ